MARLLSARRLFCCSSVLVVGLCVVASLAVVRSADAHSTSVNVPDGHGGVTASHLFAFSCDHGYYSRWRANLIYRYYDPALGTIRERRFMPREGDCQQTTQLPRPVIEYWSCSWDTWGSYGNICNKGPVPT